MTAEHTASHSMWTDLEPYGQLIGALLPRASGLSLFDVQGEMRWTSEESVDAGLAPLVRQSFAASVQSEDAGERVTLARDVHAYLFWLRDETRETSCIAALTWRCDGEPRSFAFVHGLLRHAIEVLRRELRARARIEILNAGSGERDRDLDVLLLASRETERGALTGDEIRGILQNTTNHLRCEFTALIMPERNLVVIRTAEGRQVDTSILARVHRHLLSLAQVHTEPAILAPGALPGVRLPLRVLSAPVRNPSGRAAGVLVLFRALEMPEFRERDAQLTDLLARRLASIVDASFDALSGLLTRGAFEHRARAAMESRLDDRGAVWSGLYIDTDRMHVINDNYGMHVGDRLIAKLGELIRSRLVPGALAARISGDRFAILLPTGAADAVAFAEALRIGVAALRPAHLGATADASFSASISIGVSDIADPRVEFSHAFAVAETACKAAKDRGRNRVELYQTSDVSIMRRYEDVNIAPSLRAAIVENRMRLDAQLIVPLDAAQENVPHFELLVRMIDERGDTVGPDRFMSAAVRYQLMPAVDRWVLEEAIRQLRPHAELLADRPLVFTINLSGQSLNEPDFAGYLVGLVRDSGLNPRVFCFEITESAAIANLVKAEELMRRLRSMGCEFALDDFGTGLSSLAYLRSLPVDMLKIDGSFVRDILKDPRAESMVQAIAHLSRSMNLVTVAEYVETDEIRLRVAALGVDYGQGFAIARPVPLSEIVLELPMYSTAALQPVDASPAGEISISEEDLEATLDAMAAAAAAGNAEEVQIGSNDDTHRRLEIILGGHDHSESTVYQRAARI